MDEVLAVELGRKEVALLLQLINQVSGMENARQLLPIYDKLKAAAEQPAKA